MTYHRWTEVDIETARSMVASGMTYQEIADAIGTTKMAVAQKICVMAKSGVVDIRSGQGCITDGAKRDAVARRTMESTDGIRLDETSGPMVVAEAAHVLAESGRYDLAARCMRRLRAVKIDTHRQYSDGTEWGTAKRDLMSHAEVDKAYKRVQAELHRWEPGRSTTGVSLNCTRMERRDFE